MLRYRFPGFSDFLHAASEQIGHPEAEAPARRIHTLSSLANLCAQAGAAEPSDVAAILAKADEFRDQLKAALIAAEMMLEHVREALAPTEILEEVESAAAPKGTKVKKRRES